MLGLRRLQEECKAFGRASAIRAYFVRLARQILSVRVLEAVAIESVSAKVIETDPRFTCRFLSQKELLRFAGEPGYELDEAFLADAWAKGDECFAILDGDKLAAYGWYSHGATEIFPGFHLTFDPRYIYMYKGFTARDYRGQRLHAVGMGRALNEYLAAGYRGIVSYVEADNLASLRSCERMGYRRFGRVLLGDVVGRSWSWSSAGCRQYAFEVATELPVAEVRSVPVERRQLG